MAIKLNETQRALLGAAAQRGDHFFIFPDGRRLAAARQAANVLVAAGLAREVRARSEAPIWRRDKDSQCAFALKLTAAERRRSQLSRMMARAARNESRVAKSKMSLRGRSAHRAATRKERR